MAILVTVLLALVAGFLAYLLARVFDYTREYAQPIGLVVAVLVVLARLGYGL